MHLRKFLPALAIICICLVSCSKDSDDDSNPEMNTWSFKAEGSYYHGELFWDPLLNTFLQSNDTYTFGLLGGEENSDNVFNIVLSLADTTFTEKNYQSGEGGSDHITSMYYTVGVGGNNIFQSSNTNPGAVMNYTIESYDAATRVLVLTFNGNVYSANGSTVAITEGKVTCMVEKLQ